MLDKENCWKQQNILCENKWTVSVNCSLIHELLDEFDHRSPLINYNHGYWEGKYWKKALPQGQNRIYFT